MERKVSGESVACDAFILSGMDLQQFIRTRPRLYHLTARSNLEHIRETGGLHPAEFLFQQAGRLNRNRERRREPETVRLNGTMITIRDQQPLREKNCDLQGSWSFADLVEHLNRHVYFWPGNEGGPVRAGKSHFGRYRDDDVIVLECDTKALFEINPDLPPLFCRFNSGSPRSRPKYGKPPRGAGTFLPHDRFEKRPCDVVECVFRGEVRLPDFEERLVRDFL